MPVIRLNDAIFYDLRTLATWLGTKTPSDTINQLVREKMDQLDLERDIDESHLSESGRADDLVFDRAPSLTFTRILSAVLDREEPHKTNWAGLLIAMIAAVKEKKGLSVERLLLVLEVPAKKEEYTEDGYRFYPHLGISVQGQSAIDSWKEVSRLADKYQIPVKVRFQWRDNEKALHPGKIGIIRAGGHVG